VGMGVISVPVQVSITEVKRPRVILLAAHEPALMADITADNVSRQCRPSMSAATRWPLSRGLYITGKH